MKSVSRLDSLTLSFCGTTNPAWPTTETNLLGMALAVGVLTYLASLLIEVALVYFWLSKSKQVMPWRTKFRSNSSR